MITICFTYFRSLTLAHLAAALYSIAQQDLSRVESIVLLDNNTEDSEWDIRRVAEGAHIPATLWLLSVKHGDPTKTHSWSTNAAVRQATTPWVLFCRADYLLDSTLVSRFMQVLDSHLETWNGFVTSHGYHLAGDIAQCEQAGWREQGAGALRRLGGAEIDYAAIDSGVWMTRRSMFFQVGGLDEKLTAWGHAQTHFQFKLHAAGFECVCLPEVLYYHPLHSAPRDIGLAHQQLQERGVDIKQLWERHGGAKIY